MGAWHSVWYHLETHLGIIITPPDRAALRFDPWVRLYALGVYQCYREVYDALMECRMVS